MPYMNTKLVVMNLQLLVGGASLLELHFFFLYKINNITDNTQTQTYI
jgi:hypothetical protein